MYDQADAKPGYLIKKTDVIIKTDKTLQEGEDYTYTEAADYKSGTVKIHAVTRIWNYLSMPILSRIALRSPVS